MPSRAEAVRLLVRVRTEWVARAAALALLAWALWRAIAPMASSDRVIDSAALSSAVGEVLARDGATHIRVQGVVTPPARDVVAAARRAGARVSWSGDSALAWAAAAVPEPGPAGLIRVAVAGAGECRGTGTVEDRGRGTVEDRGRGTVEERGIGTVKDRGTGTVKDRGTGTVEDRGIGTVKDRGIGTVKDRGTGTVEDRGRGTVECGGVLGDTLGVIDTVTLRDGGATATLAPGRALRFAASQAVIPLAIPPRDTLPWRALVLARAGWEAKFVMAALEEHGWIVSARLAVAPGAEVTQGENPSLAGPSLAGPSLTGPSLTGPSLAGPSLAGPSRDHSSRSRSSLIRDRFDVIVVLDSASVGPDVAMITRFVRGGGGVVLAGDGAAALAAIAPARAGMPGRAPRGDAVVSRASLPLRELTGMRADVVVLDTRGRLAAVAARAEELGRVVQIGYDDTWRWRMQGGATAVADHRAFWARALSGAAPERAVLPRAPEGAPRARLEDAWGPASAAPASPDGGSNRRWIWPLVALLLVAEWGSRRARGVA